MGKKLKFGIAILVISCVGVVTYLFVTCEGREYQKQKEDIQEDFEYIIRFCEENQEDLVEIAELYLGMVDYSDDFEEIKDVISQVSHPEWKRISETLGILHPSFENLKEMDKMYFYTQYCYGPFEVKVFYYNADDKTIEDYLAGRYPAPSKYVKICDHLYVCLEEQQLV